MKTNEEGHVWLEKSQAYVCPSYLNKTYKFTIPVSKGKI